MLRCTVYTPVACITVTLRHGWYCTQQPCKHAFINFVCICPYNTFELASDKVILKQIFQVIYYIQRLQAKVITYVLKEIYKHSSII